MRSDLMIKRTSPYQGPCSALLREPDSNKPPYLMERFFLTAKLKSLRDFPLMRTIIAGRHSMDIPGHFNPKEHEAWWPQYQEILQSFFAEHYLSVEEKITHLLTLEEDDELPPAFHYALYRLWLEVLHLQQTAHPHHPGPTKNILRELSTCLERIAAHEEANSPIKALQALSKLYLGDYDSAQAYKKSVSPNAFQDPYHEELFYKLEAYQKESELQNSNKEAAVDLPFAGWLDHSKPTLDLTLPLYDYCHLQTLLAAYLAPYTSESIYDPHYRGTLKDYIQNLFGSSPLNAWVKVYQALDQGRLQDAHNEAFNLCLTFPANPTFRALMHHIEQKTPDPLTWFGCEIQLLEALLQKDSREEAALSLLATVSSMYLRFKCQENVDLPEELEQKFLAVFDSTQKKYHLSFNNQTHPSHSSRKAWLCFVSHKEYLQHLEKKSPSSSLFRVSLENPVHNQDWVYVMRKSGESSRLMGIYEIKATLPQISGLEKNTVLRPLLVFSHAHLPSIKLPLEETDTSDEADLKRRFGADLSFELGPAAHNVIISEMKEQMFLDPSSVVHLQKKWDTLA